MSPKALIVEDDAAVRNTLDKVLTSSGIQSVAVASGQEAINQIAADTFDVVLLDINLDGMDGFEVIRLLREKGNHIPVMVVSGRTEDVDMLYSLEIGADDYITKPFNPVTLAAKVKALIRRSHTSGANIPIEAGPFRFDNETLKFFKNGTELALSAKESAIMKLFLDNPNRIFSKSSLYDLIWGSTMVDDSAIVVYINRLRNKIEDDPSRPRYIQTVRGLGYRFVP
ncbi:MAG: response regulator transcription factor [Oscillospiraceae bacterium]|nr:response regulator transcription factor [Oscillospiraceae bacterium]